jgi:diaminopimelate epimerase
VAFVESLDDAGELDDPPSFDRGDYPKGVNVEFVERVDDRHLAMRGVRAGRRRDAPPAARGRPP